MTSLTADEASDVAALLPCEVPFVASLTADEAFVVAALLFCDVAAEASDEGFVECS